ncbi:unnamed protein product [Schistosoma curassoni]|uniref:Uncharacterized protein n=1 Tax=Schistosoma curassoni TaxID=6186 RepID=A0A183KCT7_9TREM|nr:unnamed protein product [Schistosoma curassoni]
MEDVRTRRGADSFRSPSGYGQDETESKETLNSWEDSGTKVQYSLLTRYCQIQRIQDNSQQQVPGLTRSTVRRRNYDGRQLKKDQIRINFNVSGGAVSQAASS